jgi:hypothetical protein
MIVKKAAGTLRVGSINTEAYRVNYKTGLFYISVGLKCKMLGIAERWTGLHKYETTG